MTTKDRKTDSELEDLLNNVTTKLSLLCVRAARALINCDADELDITMTTIDTNCAHLVNEMAVKLIAAFK